MKNEKKVYYMALWQHYTDIQRWENCVQVPIYGTWSDAVITCKLQDTSTRLSESSGFNNQGHYFQPEYGNIS